jgi:hypothetical protein
MKKIMFIKGIGALMIIAIVGIMASCEGPAGAPGKDGIAGTPGTNGTNGKDGKDANSSCIVCHSLANMDTLMNQYHLSKHFTGTAYARNTKYCARCHTSQGFEEIVANKTFTVANDIPNGSKITCQTCHKHSAFDFAGDTATFILRTTSPVLLNYQKNTVATDFGEINNLCVNCHQIRGATAVSYIDTTVTPSASKAFTQLAFFPLDNSKEGTTVKYQVGQSFSVHDGNQSNLFKGINAYEYAGVTYTRTWKHSDQACTDCHMNTYNPATKTGGHTLIPNEAECLTCHNNSDKIALTQTSIKAKLTELAEILTTRKVFKKTVKSGVTSYSAEASHDFYGNLFPTTQSTTAFGIATATGNTVSSTTGLVVYNSKITYGVDTDYANRIGREWKYGELGAAYNYGYINSELSFGVHNPVYALKVLQSSIDWLNANK